MTGLQINWLQDDIVACSTHEYRTVCEICQENTLPTDLVARLLEQERQMQGMHRRSGIFQRIDQVLQQEWRDETTIRKEHGLPLLETSEEILDHVETIPLLLVTDNGAA